MNKMFKKTLSIVMAIAMLASMATGVFASEVVVPVNGAENSAEQGIEEYALYSCPSCGGSITSKEYAGNYEQKWINGNLVDGRNYRIDYHCPHCNFSTTVNEWRVV